MKSSHLFKFCLFCQESTPHDLDGSCVICINETREKERFTQIWKCHRCDTSGAIQFREGEKPDLIISKIISDHKVRSPLCDRGAGNIEVFHPLDSWIFYN